VNFFFVAVVENEQYWQLPVKHHLTLSLSAFSQHRNFIPQVNLCMTICNTNAKYCDLRLKLLWCWIQIALSIRII